MTAPPIDSYAGRAVISDCGKYRYTLERSWAQLPRYVLWLMLNPSTADAATDDATIRRCLRFSGDWGYTGILVGNLYAYRSTNPDALAGKLAEQNKYDDAAPLAVIGPENDRHLVGLIRRASLVVCAWGKPGPIHARRWQVMRLLHESKTAAHVLRFNMPVDSGQREPSHPLRLGHTLQPILWEMFPDQGAGVGG